MIYNDKNLAISHSEPLLNKTLKRPSPKYQEKMVFKFERTIIALKIYDKYDSLKGKKFYWQNLKTFSC